MMKNNRKIYIKVSNGLCNRLRTLNSFANLAERTGSELFVCWEKTFGFGDEKFNDLFENRINLITSKEYELFSKNVLNLDKVILKQEKNPGLYELKKDKKYLLEIVNNKNFCYCGDSCIEWMLGEFFSKQENYNFLKSLVLKKELNVEIENFCAGWPENVIGVHVRRGDAWTSPWSEFYKKSSNESFFKLIVKEKTADPNLKFFLSTDCEETQKLFIYKFGKEILFRKKDFLKNIFYNEYKKNQVDALIDLIILSKTKKVIGSNWSSFSFISTKFFDIELITALR